MLDGLRGFFFSSRRRHTRWNCDWSSDVCSSDLIAAIGGQRRPGGGSEAIFDFESIILSRSEEHTSELQSQFHLVCRHLLEKKKNNNLPNYKNGDHNYKAERYNHDADLQDYVVTV